ncbi:mCG140906 [Mus musculus]|uniref:Uncharacterized protein n=1 Tax=Mus musculus TaxID=10090 RepID=Q9D5W2_MOUSE|nr:mCG140906 [Mus musculus]BAB29601.1 unnamed protein product [Mus musculus]
MNINCCVDTEVLRNRASRSLSLTPTILLSKKTQSLSSFESYFLTCLCLHPVRTPEKADDAKSLLALPSRLLPRPCEGSCQVWVMERAHLCLLEVSQGTLRGGALENFQTTEAP